MHIIELKERQDISENIKLSRKYAQLGNFLKELKKKELPLTVIEAVNNDIEAINSIPQTESGLTKSVTQKQAKIIKLLEKELKIVPINYYRNLWTALGLSVFGLPIGSIFGLTFRNGGLLGIGLPIGMLIGIVVGLQMDKKAFEEGRQLAIEIKD
ncbi:hypothetical protein [Flavobacterium sp.]|jgi:hypothetical protein|uniref:hypothetical protein n=1 Tax=Flavobacterium sp. TaxID=239 RepID=UPI0022C0A2F9|nr:hypothetical protein [Flavobacterium sp.]MCZ8227918.1 hypothetical protein [Flavobacterium sp.]